MKLRLVIAVLVFITILIFSIFCIIITCSSSSSNTKHTSTFSTRDKTDIHILETKKNLTSFTYAMTTDPLTTTRGDDINVDNNDKSDRLRNKAKLKSPSAISFTSTINTSGGSIADRIKHFFKGRTEHREQFLELMIPMPTTCAYVKSDDINSSRLLNYNPIMKKDDGSAEAVCYYKMNSSESSCLPSVGSLSYVAQSIEPLVDSLGELASICKYGKTCPMTCVISNQTKCEGKTHYKNGKDCISPEATSCKPPNCCNYSDANKSKCPTCNTPGTPPATYLVEKTPESTGTCPSTSATCDIKFCSIAPSPSPIISNNTPTPSITITITPTPTPTTPTTITTTPSPTSITTTPYRTTITTTPSPNVPPPTPNPKCLNISGYYKGIYGYDPNKYLYIKIQMQPNDPCRGTYSITADTRDSDASFTAVYGGETEIVIDGNRVSLKNQTNTQGSYSSDLRTFDWGNGDKWVTNPPPVTRCSDLSGTYLAKSNGQNASWIQVKMNYSDKCKYFYTTSDLNSSDENMSTQTSLAFDGTTVSVSDVYNSTGKVINDSAQKVIDWGNNNSWTKYTPYWHHVFKVKWDRGKNGGDGWALGEGVSTVSADDARQNIESIMKHDFPIARPQPWGGYEILDGPRSYRSPNGAYEYETQFKWDKSFNGWLHDQAMWLAKQGGTEGPVDVKNFDDW